MHAYQRWIALAAVGGGLIVSGCSDSTDATTVKTSPVSLYENGDSDIKQVQLTDTAAQRLGIELGEVTEEAGTKIIPYAAVVYDKDGSTWAYTTPSALTFERTSITVAEIRDDKAFLTAGPSVGTAVVTVGTAELFGAEQGIGA